MTATQTTYRPVNDLWLGDVITLSDEWDAIQVEIVGATSQRVEFRGDDGRLYEVPRECLRPGHYTLIRRGKR